MNKGSGLHNHTWLCSYIGFECCIQSRLKHYIDFFLFLAFGVYLIALIHLYVCLIFFLDVSSGPHVARHSLSYIQEIGNGWFGKVS